MLPQTEFIRHGKSNAHFTFITFSMLCCLNEYFPCHLLSVAHITHTRLVKNRPCTIGVSSHAAQSSVRYRIYYKKRVLSFADTKSVKNRTLFDLPLATYACSFALSVLVIYLMIYLIPTKVPIRISTPIINGTTGFLTKPAMM